MFERYSERARRAIFFAREEALHRNANAIETSDLVLGLLREAPERDSPLTPLHEQVAELRTLFAVEAFPPDSRILADIPLTPGSKMALAYAAQEADQEDTHIIVPDHLLRGVLRTEDGTAKKLAQRGTTLRSMRSASNASRHGKPKPTLPLRWRLRIYRLRILLAVGFAVFLATVLYMHFQR
jgi:ATP-dependent Clp protease ATP-binding subunit ClpC